MIPELWDLLPPFLGLQHPTTGTQGLHDEVGEVCMVPFTHYLPFSTVPGLLPRSASITLHHPHVPLLRSGCSAEQRCTQQPTEPGDNSLPSKPKEAAVPFENLGGRGGGWGVGSSDNPHLGCPQGASNLLLTPENPSIAGGKEGVKTFPGQSQGA